MSFRFGNLFGCLLLLGICTVQAPVAQTQTDADLTPAQVDTDAELEATLGYEPIRITVTKSTFGLMRITRKSKVDGLNDRCTQMCVKQVAAISFFELTSESCEKYHCGGIHILATSEEREKLRLEGRNKLLPRMLGLECEYACSGITHGEARVANFSAGSASVQVESDPIRDVENVYVWGVAQAIYYKTFNQYHRATTGLIRMLYDCPGGARIV